MLVLYNVLETADGADAISEPITDELYVNEKNCALSQ
jgi:hypothetical protein